MKSGIDTELMLYKSFAYIFLFCLCLLIYMDYADEVTTAQSTHQDPPTYIYLGSDECLSGVRLRSEEVE